MKHLEFKQIASRDLANHLSFRLATVAQDFMDRCETIGISDKDATLMALNVMLSYSASAADSLKISERGFVLLCRKHFQQEQADEATG